MEARIEAAPTDDDRLRRAVAGDVAALEGVARDWYVRIRRWALLELGDPTLAEDACQDTFVQLIRHVSTYDPERPFGPWLRAVVRSCCHRVRRGQHRHVHEILEDTHLRAVPDPEHTLDVERAASRAVESFEALTPRQREIVHLCAGGGLSAAEAARSLGISPSTARVLMFKARQTLLAAIGRTR